MLWWWWLVMVLMLLCCRFSSKLPPTLPRLFSVHGSSIIEVLMDASWEHESWFFFQIVFLRSMLMGMARRCCMLAGHGPSPKISSISKNTMFLIPSPPGRGDTDDAAMSWWFLVNRMVNLMFVNGEFVILGAEGLVAFFNSGMSLRSLSTSLCALLVTSHHCRHTNNCPPALNEVYFWQASGPWPTKAW